MPRSALDKRLQIRLDRLTPTVRREILRALDRLQKSVNIQKILDALDRGDFWSFERLVAGLPKDLERASRELQRAFTAGVNAARATLPVTLKIGGPNLAASEAARTSAARFVTGVTQETRKAIRVALSQGFMEGRTVRQIAQDIKPLIGLTARQTRAVMTRRAQLLAQGRKASEVDRLVTRYSATLLQQRATMIARTEVIKASTDGKIAAWKDARAKGQLSARLVKAWIVTPDDRLCPICAPLDGQQASIEGMFHTSAGSVIGPPVHPNCRCAVGLVEARQPVRRVA